MVALVVVMLLGIAGVAVAGPSGEWLDGGEQAEGGVVKYGPINPVNGFPDWYRDKNGEEVEPCLFNSDPMCNGPLEAPNPDAEISFPDNFPDEFFYFTGEASMTANGANDVLALYTIEGTYGGGNTQTVFGRTRYRIRGGLQAGAEYKVTNPYGVDSLRAGDDGTIFVTDDVGVGSGNFGGLFEGQVGPFLKWSSDKPAGYLGDPAVPHTVTGSPYGTNFVKVEGPGVGGPNNPNPCPGAGSSPDCIYTELFSILGKESTRGGVDVARASYSLAADEGAKPQLDVMAESKAAQDIVVQDIGDGADRRFPVTPLDGEQGRYFTRVDVDGELPKRIEVVNRKDIPETVKNVVVTDAVIGTAMYDTDEGHLHVQAESSDKTAPLSDLRVAGFDRAMDSAGAADIATLAPPTSVRVRSQRGGSVDLPVQVQGDGRPPLRLLANAGGDQTVEPGSTVALDGNASTGNIDRYEWTGPAGIAIRGAGTPAPAFTAPDAEGDYTFTLKVTGPDGTPAVAAESTDTVNVHVNPLRDAAAKIAYANALTDPATPVAVPQNLPLTIDAGQSVGAGSFSWARVRGPQVDLGATDKAKLTFMFPKTADDLVLRLTVRQPGVGAGGCTAPECASTEVTLHPEPDVLVIGKARYDAGSLRWVIDGTATSIKSNKVQVYSGNALSPAMRIGSSDVLGDGTWSVDAGDSSVLLTTCQCVTVVSDRGGQVVGTKLEKVDRLPPGTADSGTFPGTGGAVGASATPGAGRPLAAASLVAPALAIAPATTAPRAVAAAAFRTTGVPLTVAVPAGATLVRVRVLTTRGARLFQSFHKVHGGTKARLRIRSAKLRRKLRAGRRYVIEVRAGTARNRLGKATRRHIRIRR